MQVIISHCMNVFGERQHPEKFIPMTIKRAKNGEKVLIHSDKTKTIPGSRFYIHARNVASAVLFLMNEGEFGEKYNIVGEREVDNLELAKCIAGVVGVGLDYEMVDFHSSRPGHDLRYALDGTKMKELGWSIPVGFEESLERTIRWTLAHKEWLCG
jgi:dTDP-glucose 4,6-dehydratase